MYECALCTLYINTQETLSMKHQVENQGKCLEGNGFSEWNFFGLSRDVGYCQLVVYSLQLRWFNSSTSISFWATCDMATTAECYLHNQYHASWYCTLTTCTHTRRAAHYTFYSNWKWCLPFFSTIVPLIIKLMNITSLNWIIVHSWKHFERLKLIFEQYHWPISVLRSLSASFINSATLTALQLDVNHNPIILSSIQHI